MAVLSSEPIVLVGPGSEWFWTAASGLVLGITFLAIWRQLQIARDANAFEHLSRIEQEWGSELLTRSKIRAARAIISGSTPPYGPTGTITSFCERLGALARAGHVGPRILYESLGPSLRLWWTLMAPTVSQMRIDEADDTILINFEWLVHRFAALAGKDGIRSFSYDRDTVVGMLGTAIEGWEDRLRMFEESRGHAAMSAAAGV